MPKKAQKTPKTPKKVKCYLQEAELSVLQELQIEWNKQPDKRSRDAFVKSTVLPKIQELNKDKFGPEKISTCKESKKLWERRTKVGISYMFTTSFLLMDMIRRFMYGSTITSHTRIKRSSKWSVN